MNTLSSPVEDLLLQPAYDFYDKVVAFEESPAAKDQASAQSLLDEMHQMMKAMLDELRSPTAGIITEAAIKQYEGLQVSVLTRGTMDDDSVFIPGQVRLLSPRFLPGIDRPVAVLLLEQEYETDEWTIIPFSPFSSPLLEGEWQTDVDEPLVRVLCFWNATRVRGCVLDESQCIGSLNDDEFVQCTALHEDWAADRPWSAADLARSGDRWSASYRERSEHEDHEREIMRALTLIMAFRPPTPGGTASLAASAGDAWAPHEQTYRLPGFGRKLRLKSSSAGVAEVVLGECDTPQTARLDSPALVTGVGTEYPLNEGVPVQVPMRELARGFWINVGDLGWASLMAEKA